MGKASFASPRCTSVAELEDFTSTFSPFHPAGLQVDLEVLWQPERSKAVCRVLQALGNADICFALNISAAEIKASRGPFSCFLWSSLSGHRSPEGLRLEAPLRSVQSNPCLTAASVRAGTASQLGIPVSPGSETLHLWAT